jgi:hypothetical protein
MAELAAGVRALDLVPGDPDELDRLAARLDVFAGGMGDAANKLTDVHAAGWTGPAADAFGGLVGEQPAKYHKAGSAFGQAVGAIHGYTAVLRRAQADAGRAVTQFTDASAQSQSWQRAHSAHEAQVRSAKAVGDPPPPGPAPPASDPAASDLAASRQLLADARSAVQAQGRVAAAALVAATDGAPEKPGLMHRMMGGIGDFVGGAGHALSSVWHATEGVLEDVGGFLKDVWDDFGPDLLEIAAGALMMVAGGMVITIGLGMEGGGLILDATGVGAIAGVPINVAGVAVIAGGLVIIGGGGVMMMKGGSDLGDDIRSSDSDSGSSGASKEDPAARQQRLDDLSKDPDKGGTSNAGSRKEAEDALNLEDNGDVPGPVRRADPSTNPSENGADFIDGEGQPWDHKIATSQYGKFDPRKYLDKIQQNDIANGEKIMLNHEGLNPADLSNLLKEIDARGISGEFKFWPPL